MERYDAIRGLEPQDVLRCFWDLSAIPREPGLKQPVSDFMVSYVQGLGLEVRQDDAYNVIACKPATPGYEDAPTVMLQAHLDMVCEKEPGVEHDFQKDPLRLLVEDGDKITADGTTLGADDGLGVAVIMAILADKTIEHPAIEAVFTTDEETNMNGAYGLDFSKLKSKIILNLDSSAVQVSGAGELEVSIDIGAEKKPLPQGLAVCALEVSGLKGGHSGAQAMQELGSAIALMARVLCALEKELPYHLIRVQGGRGFPTAFARNASAVIALEPGQVPFAQEITARCLADFRKELAKRDPGVEVVLRPTGETAFEAFTESVKDTLLTLLTCLPDGLFSLNREFEGAMESCSNVGVLETYPDRIYVDLLIRSVTASKKYQLFDKVARLSKALHVVPTVRRDLPQWDYSMDDDLLKLICDTYDDHHPTLSEGTLEAGIFCENMPGVSFVALAPPYYNAHSPREYFLASECRDNYRKLIALLSRIH